MTVIHIPKRLVASLALLVTLSVGAVAYAATSEPTTARPAVTGTPTP